MYLNHDYVILFTKKETLLYYAISIIINLFNSSRAKKKKTHRIHLDYINKEQLKSISQSFNLIYYIL